MECKQLTTAKMHKIYTTQNSYCACCVLSLATIRSKHYFNFILNRTRPGQELFDRPSYIHTYVMSHSLLQSLTKRQIFLNLSDVLGVLRSVVE